MLILFVTNAPAASNAPIWDDVAKSNLNISLASFCKSGANDLTNFSSMVVNFVIEFNTLVKLLSSMTLANSKT